MKHTLNLTVITNDETKTVSVSGDINGNVGFLGIGLVSFLEHNIKLAEAFDEALTYMEEGKIKDVSRTIN